MIKIKDKTLCCGCGACANMCKCGCVTMLPDKDGFFYPVVDTEQCSGCGQCERVCPLSNASEDDTLFYEDRTKTWVMSDEIGDMIRREGKGVKSFAAYNSEGKIRCESTSGGLFSLLASCVIDEGGVVFGVAFDENFRVVHKCVDNVDGLKEMRGSKYVQSNTLDTFSMAKDFLEKGLPVYYSGTPCQIEGLMTFLRKDYARLITQDCICHGVPSPQAWADYLSILPFSPTEVSFRDKRESWAMYSFSASDRKGNSIFEERKNNRYLMDFLSDKSLRPSCYHCRFKKVHRISDITLGDFWGIDKVLPEMNDDKGISLILLHTEKGKRLFERVKDNIVCYETEIVRSLKCNPSYVTSPIPGAERCEDKTIKPNEALEAAI